MSNYAGGIQSLGIALNPIPTGCCHVTLIYGLIPPMAGRNWVKVPSANFTLFDRGIMNVNTTN